MDNIRILAQSNEDSPSWITSEPLSGEESSRAIVSSEPNAYAARPRAKRGFDTQSLFFLGLMFLVMYFILFRGPRKKQQQHKKMVQSLKKSDKIRTIGGIIGTVVDIKDDEITLKVDESNNTKIKVAPSAIGKNVSLGKGGE